MSLLRGRRSFDDAAIIHNRNSPRVGCGTVLYTADWIKKIWKFVEDQHGEWQKFVLSWSDDDPRIKKAISRLELGVMKEVVHYPPSYESLMLTWENFGGLEASPHGNRRPNVAA